MNIFNSLGSNYNAEFVLRSLSNQGKHSREELKKLLEEKYSGKAVLTYKGRQAIELALHSISLTKDAGVAVTGYTCIAVIEAVEKENLKPVYLDIDPQTLNFTAKTLEEKIKKENIRAVIIQNTLGYPCEIEDIMKICKKHKLILIEDLAHSIGAIYKNGKEAGTLGDFVILSFSQDKVIDAVSGGALITRNNKFTVYEKGQPGIPSLQDRLYPLLTWIIRTTYPIEIGKVLHLIFKSLKLLSDPMKNTSYLSLSNWHAGLCFSQYKKLEKDIARRRRIAQIYADTIDKALLSPVITTSINHATNLRFPIFTQNRKRLIQSLKKRGVHISDIWYDSPVAPKKYLGLARYPKSSCEQAETISETMVNLPTHIQVSEESAYRISHLINTWLKQQ